MPLFCGPRGRMLASQGHNACIIVLDITALIDSFSVGCSGTVVSLGALASAADHWSFAGLGVRYHHVLGMARLPGNLDIQGLCRLARV